MHKSRWHKRLSDFEMFDKVTLEVIPRYKTSGLSGDEWRQHVEVTFWFKGNKVGAHGFRDMDAAVLGLGGKLLEARDGGMTDQMLKLDDELCDQPSCAAPATNVYRIKRQTSERGQWLDAEEGKYHDAFRKFCDVHARRGDCGREDADDNYVVESGSGPGGSTNRETSPSAQMTVRVGGVDEIPAAVAAARASMKKPGP